MSLSTSLRGRLRNTNLPKSNALFPLFEAVVNSIHSIDEREKKDANFDRSNGRIIVSILRSSVQNLYDNSKPEIIGFKISDNGIGFTDDNYESFKTLDSEYKMDIGCRGVGRLLWLKAYKQVKVQSVFQAGEILKKRVFDFNISKDIHNEGLEEVSSIGVGTEVALNEIGKNYKDYIPKTAGTIANALLEHCLWYFIREGGAPDIVIEDTEDRISLNQEFEQYMLNASEPDSFEIAGEVFEVTHVKLKSTSQNKHSVIYSAADRVVKEESLTGKIPGLFGVLYDGENRFSYLCFVTSQYLTDHVTPERMAFNIAETKEKSETQEELFADSEITFKDIRENVIGKIAEYLGDFLKENRRLGLQKVNDFVAERAPRYRPILNRIPEDERIVDPSISDKELELKLHNHLMSLESELLKEGHELMKPSGVEDFEEYSKKVDSYLSKASDIKKSDLASYVTHRKIILDLLSKALEINDGKYSKEDVVHKLIMPMRVESNDIHFEDSNLWLIDERLAFHNYLASDKTLKSMPVTDSESGKEPDLLGLNVYDNPLLVNEGQSLPLASITVVEIKRPMRNDARAGEDKNPIEQALGYLKRIRAGGIKTSAGRPIPNSEDVPGFCYVVADLTDSVIERCQLLSLQVTSDKLGYFGYNPNYKAFIEVISFDRLVNMAKERNRAFFDKLGLPTN